MVNELGILARDIIRVIEREDAFYNAKQKGGFKKVVKAKTVQECSSENWSLN